MAKRHTAPAVVATMRELVLDCSLVFSWYFVDEANSYADDVARALGQGRALVPQLWPLEVANVLVMGERRRRSTEAQAAVFLSRLANLPIILDNRTAAQAWSATIRLARSHKLSVYDAAYLELALRRGLPIATLDAPLLSAAQASGVQRFMP